MINFYFEEKNKPTFEFLEVEKKKQIILVRNTWSYQVFTKLSKKIISLSFYSFSCKINRKKKLIKLLTNKLFVWKFQVPFNKKSLSKVLANEEILFMLRTVQNIWI